MKARRGVYIAFFLVAALGASALVYFAQPRNGIVRATVDIAVLTPITADMLEIVSVSPADAPPNTARTLDAVVGRYASVPILAGQDVDRPGARDESRPIGLRLRRATRGRPGRLRDPGRAGAGGWRRARARRPRRRRRRPERAQDSGLGRRLAVGRRPRPGARRPGAPDARGAPLTDDAGRPAAARVVIPPKLGSVVVAIPAARLASSPRLPLARRSTSPSARWPRHEIGVARRAATGRRSLQRGPGPPLRSTMRRFRVEGGSAAGSSSLP